MIRTILLAAIVLSNSAVFADVGLPKPAVGLHPSTNHVRCIHFKGNGSEKLDQFSLVLPSANSGEILESETFSFADSLTVFGPNGPQQVPLQGLIEIRMRKNSSGALLDLIDINGSLKTFNPFMNMNEELLELQPSIYLETAFFKNRLRDLSKSSFASDFASNRSELGGWFHCEPINSGFGAKIDPTWGRAIQGVKVPRSERH